MTLQEESPKTNITGVWRTYLQFQTCTISHKTDTEPQQQHFDGRKMESLQGEREKWKCDSYVFVFSKTDLYTYWWYTVAENGRVSLRERGREGEREREHKMILQNWIMSITATLRWWRVTKKCWCIAQSTRFIMSSFVLHQIHNNNKEGKNCQLYHNTAHNTEKTKTGITKSGCELSTKRPMNYNPHLQLFTYQQRWNASRTNGTKIWPNIYSK